MLDFQNPLHSTRTSSDVRVRYHVTGLTQKSILVHALTCCAIAEAPAERIRPITSTHSYCCLRHTTIQEGWLDKKSSEVSDPGLNNDHADRMRCLSRACIATNKNHLRHITIGPRSFKLHSNECSQWPRPSLYSVIVVIVKNYTCSVTSTIL